MADKNIKVCYGLETAGIQIIFPLSDMAVAGANILVFPHLRPGLSGTRQASNPDEDEDS